MSKIYEQYKKVAECGLGLTHFKQITFNEDVIILCANYTPELQQVFEGFGFQFELSIWSKSINSNKDGISIHLDLTNIK